MKPLLIKGASAHGVVAAEAATFRWKVVGFVDAAAGATGLIGAFGPLLGLPTDIPELLLKHGAADIFVAIGDNFTRKKAVAHVKSLAPHLHFPAIVHPTATICQNVEIGEGAIICAGAVVATGAKVGAFSILNTGASLDHHSTLGDYASMAPASATGGNAHIGEGAVIGMGAIIHHGTHVGPWTVVGSASLVNKNLPENVTAYGQPARVIRPRRPDERYL